MEGDEGHLFAGMLERPNSTGASTGSQRGSGSNQVPAALAFQFERGAMENSRVPGCRSPGALSLNTAME
jgi:hypothetical protein